MNNSICVPLAAVGMLQNSWSPAWAGCIPAARTGISHQLLYMCLLALHNAPAQAQPLWIQEIWQERLNWSSSSRQFGAVLRRTALHMHVLCCRRLACLQPCGILADRNQMHDLHHDSVRISRRGDAQLQSQKCSNCAPQVSSGRDTYILALCRYAPAEVDDLTVPHAPWKDTVAV